MCDRVTAGTAIIVVGAGGHAKVAIEALRRSGWDVVGCTDSDPTDRTIVGVSVLGGDEILANMHASGVRFAFPALGSNRLRQRKAQELVELGFQLPSAIGENVSISPSASVGQGVALFGGATVNADASIGDFAIINTNASIDHDCNIGSASHIAPGSTLAGGVTIGDRSFVGAGTSIIPGITVGRDCVIGAGSVVVRDIPDAVQAFGNPARIRG